ncbi:aspartate aminotransferase family protein [Sphingosinicella xenopeptidilytica]|uniref:Aspartate aminotransferase family protein n=1 Tax=Sphingosinicella xenopeptidilytica TaxID=364098 RepID=A0ABW3C100_SPHXN
MANMPALDRLKAAVFADYSARTPKSCALWERGKAVLPGGVSGNLRYFAPYPLYMATGSGSRTIDVDGNAYIDCFSCNGPLMLGHRPAAVLEEIERHRDMGPLILNPALLVECAELLAAIVPCAERVRFLNSGTEAVLSAVRYARAFTGRDKVVKFLGHYHGQSDAFLVGLTPDRRPFGAGVPASTQQDILTLPFNDIAAFEALMAERSDIAAVLLDPAMHSGGLWGASSDFLHVLRRETAARGIILIFDEVITGFRLGLAGAQGYYGVTPDLATFAKALAAGEKLGAVVGRADVMAVTDPLTAADIPRAFQSGTGNDGTAALAAAIGAMTEYRRQDAEGGYAALDTAAGECAAMLVSAFAAHGIPLHINRMASMMQLFITDAPASFTRYAELRTDLIELFYLALINHGVMLSLPTSNHVYFSFAQQAADFAAIAEAVTTVLQTYPFAEAYQELA